MNNKTMYILLFSKILLIVGAFAYSYSKIFDKDLFSFNQTFSNTIIVLILGSVIYHVLQRDYYLPFLGPTVIPIPYSDSVNEKSGELVEISLSDIPANTRVLFWASNPTLPTLGPWSNPIDAYKGYHNSGLAKTDDRGNVTIKIYCPSNYKISNKILSKHVHYRYEFPKYPGMFSSVKTKYINC